MSDMVATAERLRQVKNAYGHFLAMWALERLLAKPAAISRFHTDIIAAEETSETELENPYNHNWSLLYRGSVLDD